MCFLCFLCGKAAAGVRNSTGKRSAGNGTCHILYNVWMGTLRAKIKKSGRYRKGICPNLCRSLLRLRLFLPRAENGVFVSLPFRR